MTSSACLSTFTNFPLSSFFLLRFCILKVWSYDITGNGGIWYIISLAICCFSWIKLLKVFNKEVLEGRKSLYPFWSPIDENINNGDFVLLFFVPNTPVRNSNSFHLDKPYPWFTFFCKYVFVLNWPIDFLISSKDIRLVPLHMSKFNRSIWNAVLGLRWTG